MSAEPRPRGESFFRYAALALLLIAGLIAIAVHDRRSLGRVHGATSFGVA